MGVIGDTLVPKIKSTKKNKKYWEKKLAQKLENWPIYGHLKKIRDYRKCRLCLKIQNCQKIPHCRHIQKKNLKFFFYKIFSLMDIYKNMKIWTQVFVRKPDQKLPMKSAVEKSTAGL